MGSFNTRLTCRNHAVKLTTYSAQNNHSREVHSPFMPALRLMQEPYAVKWSPLALERYKRHTTEGQPQHRGHDLTSALADAQSKFHSPNIFSDLAGAEVGFCFASSLRALMTSSSPLFSLMASSRAWRASAHAGGGREVCRWQSFCEGA